MFQPSLLYMRKLGHMYCRNGSQRNGRAHTSLTTYYMYVDLWWNCVPFFLSLWRLSSCLFLDGIDMPFAQRMFWSMADELAATNYKQAIIVTRNFVSIGPQIAIALRNSLAVGASVWMTCWWKLLTLLRKLSTLRVCTPVVLERWGPQCSLNSKSLFQKYWGINVHAWWSAVRGCLNIRSVKQGSA